MGPAASTTRREDRRQALVLAAYRQIAQQGFEGLRTRDVAAEVGVNIATLHYYFPTKEALIDGVVAHAVERFRTTLDFEGSPADHLRNYLRGVRRLLREEPQLGLVMGELALRAPRDPALAESMAGIFAYWHRVVRGLLKHAAKNGRIRTELDSDDVAAIVVATLTGAGNPSIAAGRMGEQSIRQLERFLGLTKASSK